ncbi:hypothetical protein F5B19DRAFT_462467 [Rostrohypoxylon terebratum]|nr:hypothetical protein F5B19DRAFT_462467 [Rostrohypoxylon terebratum]
MAAFSKTFIRGALISIVILTLIAVAMSHPTNETGLSGPTSISVGNAVPSTLNTLALIANNFNHTIGFIGQEDHKSGINAHETVPHHKPCTSAAVKPASMMSRIFFTTLIIFALALILRK